MRLPQPILRLSLREFGATASTAEMNALVRCVTDLQNSHGGRAANRHLIDSIGWDLSPDLNEQYYAEALDYHLGLLYGHAGRPAEMAEHLRLSKSMPAPEDDQIFSDRISLSLATRAWQEDAKARGMPPILIACMPRSASATLTQTLSRLFDMPALHLSVGRFPNYFLAPSWVDVFMEGGALTQDHFGPGVHNLEALRRNPLSDMFVTARDPRAAACSWVHYKDGRNNKNPVFQSRSPETNLDERIERVCIDHFIPWLQGWLDRSRQADASPRIHWLTYDEVSTDLAAVTRRIVSVLAPQYPALRRYADISAIDEVRGHFQHGDDTAWRRQTSAATQERLWNAITPEMHELLHLAA